MKYRKLGRSDLNVSLLCLGSMTWGSQNTEEEGHAQIDRATASGVNFIDTAELYPTTPGTPENAGRTEEIIGSWFKKSGRRDDIILASKATGPGAARIRDGEPLSGDAIRRAIDGSLQRLGTDYIDLYQLHWANRGSYHMRQNWDYDPTGQAKDEMDAHVEDLLRTIQALKDEGKIREFGLSNETVWGTLQFIFMAEAESLPRPVSVQNEYSLLCRHFDLDFAETCHHEDIDLLAWSPLAAGLLTDKYEGGAVPSGSRLSIQDGLNKRMTPQSIEATQEYANLARKHGMTPAQLALGFCTTRPFMGSIIIGATDLEQLKDNLNAADLVLTEEVMDGIRDIRRRFPTPM